MKEDLARVSGPAVYGLRHWNVDGIRAGSPWRRIAELSAEAVRDAVIAMDAGATAPR